MTYPKLIEGVDFEIKEDETGTVSIKAISELAKSVYAEFISKEDYFGFYDLCYSGDLKNNLA